MQSCFDVFNLRRSIFLEQTYEVNSRGLSIFSKCWIPETVRPKAMVYYCHGYGDTCTFFFEGMWLLSSSRNGLVWNFVYHNRYWFVFSVLCFRNCKKVSIVRIWCIFYGLSRIWSFRRSPWFYTKLWQNCRWRHWTLLQSERCVSVPNFVVG